MLIIIDNKLIVLQFLCSVFKIWDCEEGTASKNIVVCSILMVAIIDLQKLKKNVSEINMNY